MQIGVIDCLNHMVGNTYEKILQLEDFNCKSINWVEMEVCSGAGTWSEKLIHLVMENLLKQWVNEHTRCRGTGEPSILDLVFTRRPELRPTIKYQNPMGKSDHVVLEIEIHEEMIEGWKENHKNVRINNAKVNFDELRKFFKGVEWNG